MIEPLITFREYLQRVVGDPRRTEEMQILVQLFGMPYLERVLSGEVNPQQPFQKAGAA